METTIPQLSDSPFIQPCLPLKLTMDETPLFAVIRALLDQGADLEANRSRNETPLIAAVEAGLVKTVKLPFEYGASPKATAVDDYGQPRDTAILSAARIGYLGILKTLLGSKSRPRRSSISASWPWCYLGYCCSGRTL